MDSEVEEGRVRKGLVSESKSKSETGAELAGVRCGERFGKFILRSQLGTGGMAEVFLAEETGPQGFGKLVALKRILPHLNHDQEFIAALISEARLGGSLNHPNIVQTLELGQEQGSFYVAMEYVEGTTLKALLRSMKRPGALLPVPISLEIARQVCDGLEYAHAATDPRGNPLNMVHRDLKPENVLLSRFGLTKISDFGVAKASSNVNQTATGAHALKGTVAYMSPEQACCESLDLRSDLYSLGAMLFELLTGERLYKGAVGMGGLLKVGQGQIDDRFELLEPLPEALVRLVKKVLSRDRNQRHSSAARLGRDIGEVLTTLPPAPRRLSDIVQEVLEDDSLKTISGSWVLKLGDADASGAGNEDQTIVDDEGEALAGEAGGDGEGIGLQPGVEFEELSIKDTFSSGVSDAETNKASEMPDPAAQPIGSAGLEGLEDSPLAGGQAVISTESGPVPNTVPVSPVRQRMLLVGSLGPVLVIAVLAVWFFLRQSEPDATIVIHPRPVAEIAANTMGSEMSKVVGVRQSGDPPRSADAEAHGEAPPGTMASGNVPEKASGNADPHQAPGQSVQEPGVERAEPPPPSDGPDVDVVLGKKEPPRTKNTVIRPAKAGPQTTTADNSTAEFGFLSVDARPYATVFLNGEKVDVTPLYRQRIPTGRHTLILKTRDGQEKKAVVNIAPGEETRLEPVIFQ